MNIVQSHLACTMYNFQCCTKQRHTHPALYNIDQCWNPTLYEPSFVQGWLSTLHEADSYNVDNVVWTQTRTTDVFNVVQTQLCTMLAFNIVRSNSVPCKHCTILAFINVVWRSHGFMVRILLTLHEAMVYEAMLYDTYMVWVFRTTLYDCTPITGGQLSSHISDYIPAKKLASYQSKYSDHWPFWPVVEAAG